MIHCYQVLEDCAPTTSGPYDYTHTSSSSCLLFTRSRFVSSQQVRRISCRAIQQHILEQIKNNNTFKAVSEEGGGRGGLIQARDVSRLTWLPAIHPGSLFIYPLLFLTGLLLLPAAVARVGSSSVRYNNKILPLLLLLLLTQSLIHKIWKRRGRPLSPSLSVSLFFLLLLLHLPKSL